MNEPDYTLFHRIDEPESARVRRLVVDLGLKPRISFENVESGAAGDPRLGCAPTPALWDGRRLISGENAVGEALAGIAPDWEAGG
jgi:hypothetical protein